MSTPALLRMGFSWSRVSDAGSGVILVMAARYAGVTGAGLLRTALNFKTFIPSTSPSPAGLAV